MDILFFAALAFYIFLKLNKNLGKIDDEEKKQIQEKISKRRQEIIEIQKQIAEPTKEMKVVNPSVVAEKIDDKTITHLDEKTKKVLEDIFQKSKITADFFLSGAKSSFEMIIKAFGEGNLDILKFLLSDKIYQGFESAINQRKSLEHRLTTNLISIEKSEIVSANLVDNNASIVVKIISKQINYISNKEGNVTEGRKDEICEITDIWTFTKDVTISDPKWVVSVTAK
jgi:predicted lipid-binding transport protein (Tim44 family)